MTKRNFKLIGTELRARFNEIGKQDSSDPLVVAKFFNPCGAETWYVTEYSEKNICYGYATGIWENEWGYFSISELESLRPSPLRLPIERDLYFEEIQFSKLMP